MGAPDEASGATGIDGDQSNNAAAFSGAAYVFSRSGTTWSQHACLKASNTGTADEFGTGVAVSGDTVVVGAPFEDGNATGVNGDQANVAAADAAPSTCLRAVGPRGAGAAPRVTRSFTVAPPPTIALSRSALTFSAVSSRTAWSTVTPAQTVQLSQSGSGTVTWTAVSNQPWLVVSPASGTGPASLTISAQYDPAVPASASQTGVITVRLAGAANTVGPVNVSLVTSPAATLPFGSSRHRSVTCALRLTD